VYLIEIRDHLMKPIWHIYYATRGTAGAYIDSLMKASLQGGLQVKAYVSRKYAYPTKHCVKCFFPITDFSEKRNGSILLLRALELVAAYFSIAVYATMKRPTINLHLVDDLWITYCLIRYFVFINLQVYVTCHDVRSHYLGKTNLRSKIMNIADKLVVHNKNAKTILQNTIGASDHAKINIYPFPFSSYDEVLDKEKRISSSKTLSRLIPNDKPYFLFLGVVKMQKGTEVLINAWHNSDLSQYATLVIAGKWTDPPQSLRDKTKQIRSCIVLDKYLTDEEFVLLIEKSQFVVLPYLNYTHSSILVSCGHHNGAVILSNIELFKEMMPDYPLYFSTENETELISVLKKTAAMSYDEVDKYRILTREAIQREREELVVQLRDTYIYAQ
ncbi:hypothetical protein JYU03_00480, partial [bacterium AH-315-F03]|nr:hypothetical protein [bacterium AH-315-F03]